MFVYLDTSALLKIVIDEPGRDIVSALWSESAVVATSRATTPEARAALAAAQRTGRLDVDQHTVAVNTIRERLTEATPVELDETIAEHAAELAEIHGLRGYDAVHLASALALRNPRSPRNPVILATWDRKLHKAAYDAGLVPAPAVI